MKILMLYLGKFVQKYIKFLQFHQLLDFILTIQELSLINQNVEQLLASKLIKVSCLK